MKVNTKEGPKGEFVLVPLGPDEDGAVYRLCSAESGDKGARVVPVVDSDEEGELGDFIPQTLQKYCSKKAALALAALLAAGMGFGYMAAGLTGLGIGGAVATVFFGIGKKCIKPDDPEFITSQPNP